MTKAEKLILQDIDPRMKEQAAMVWKVEKAYRKKVKQVLPIFDEQPVAQAVTNTQGEQVLKSNPATQEIRAIIRDYIAVVGVQQNLIGDKATPAEVTAIDNIRQKLKICKRPA